MRLGRLLEGNSEHLVVTEHTVRATAEYSVGTQITKRHVCAHRRRCHFTKQAFCGDTALAGMSGGPLVELKTHFGSLTKEAFLLRTQAASAAWAAWKARSDAA